VGIVFSGYRLEDIAEGRGEKEGKGDRHLLRRSKSTDIEIEKMPVPFSIYVPFSMPISCPLFPNFARAPD
jgi:hypothetical protein